LTIIGTVYNTNYLLGRNGIIGIKTGNTEQAGGCYLFAAERTLANGTLVTFIGAIMNAPDLGQAVSSAPALLDSAVNSFGPFTVVKKGQHITQYDAAWLGQPTYALADKDITLYGWKSKAPDVSIKHATISLPASQGAWAGSLTATTLLGSESTNLSLSDALPLPSWHWRFLRKS
jgi:D-alanyl-D-alanine carboxypeptidase (penicillin-binding protein 5/6)